MSGPGGVAVHASATHATSGGGMTYVTALAAALADGDDVDLFLAFESSAEVLATWLPAWAGAPHLRREPPNRSWRDEFRLAVGDRRWAVVVRDTSDVPPLSLAARSVVVTSFPFSTLARARDRARMAGYGTVLANSAFTARWVAERWHRRADVLHPPITLVAPREKRPTILSVGRFSGGGRSKRQVEMVDAFRALGPEVHRSWELALAGFVEDAAYLAEVRRRATGLPVTIHTDLDRPSLERLYGESSLYWHACGLDVDQDREPQRVEHFGITTAEAMSAGCVPVVLDSGGQPEIVGRDGNAGLLWPTTDAWIDLTRTLIDDDTERARLALGATERARRFSFDAFAPLARALVHGRAPMATTSEE